MRIISLTLAIFCLSPLTLFAQMLQITPAAMTIVEGESGTFTVVLSQEPISVVTVTIVRADGAEISLNKTELTFTSENWNVPQTVRLSATEDDNLIDDEGRLILIASGESYGENSGITVNPEIAQIELGGNPIQLETVIQDQNGESVAGLPLEWSSSDPAVAMVDSTGKITGVSNGITTITAALATASGTATILVNDPGLPLSDWESLEIFYRATGGDKWVQRDGWLTDAPLNQWYGVHTNSDGRVNNLLLQHNGLKGILPAELGNLVYLRRLNLYDNDLMGILPPEIGNLIRLQTLILNGNNLDGEIPSTLGKLTELEWLDLQSLSFTGVIPPEIGALTKLRFLSLHKNQLSGHLPVELAALSSLQQFYLAGNRLNGSIPSAFLQLEQLEKFHWLENDGLCAPRTAEFTAWRTVNDRDFQGPYCNRADLAALKQLYRATDGANWIHSTGWLTDATLDEWYGVSTDSLGRVTSLNLTNNGLRGHLPQILGDLDQLSVLKVSDNPLSGAIPLSLAALTLKEFRYANTDLCILPTMNFQQWLATISTHEGTGLQCSISDDRKILSALYEVAGGVNWKHQDGWLTDAPLGDWYGVTVNESEQVVKLQLFDNNLRGRIPGELGEMGTLRLLDLSRNWLDGIISPALGEIKTLTELYLNRNLLSGPIPAELGNLPLLDVLYLHDNQLKGAIPPELGNLSQLINLRLNRNQLSGQIPPEFENLTAVENIWIDANQLEGEIPPELGNLSSLQVLYAGNNNLSGSIPPELGNLESIVEIALDVNNLSGPIPLELGKLKNINGQINLNENNLSGKIPTELGNLTKLRILRLSHNKLSGSIPPEIGQMHALEWLDLSHNHELIAPVPPTLADLHNLRALETTGTQLCISQDSPLAEPTVARRFRIPFCNPSAEVSTAYLIQSIQSVQYPVSLIAGKDALLRVFPISAQSTDASIPPVRATLFVDGAEVYTVDIPAQSIPIPTELAYAEASLDRSANIRIPGSVIQPDLEMIVNIDPDGTLDAGLEVVRRIPESGRLTVRVEEMPTLELTMIPFVWQTQPHHKATELVQEMTQDPEGHRLLSETLTLLPVNDITVTAHAPILTSANDGHDIVGDVGAIRVLEGGKGYWMGALSGEASGPWGFAWIGGWASYVRLGNVDQSEEALTIAHELGHSMSLWHAPCGVRSVLDRGYPYSNAEIGSWGVDSRSGSDILIPSTWSDMMSYCVPAWISEYNFYIAMNHRLDQEESGKRVAASTPALLIWGGTDEEGAPYLNPVFAVNAPPSLPNGDGEYRLVGRTADGDVLFLISFNMKSLADTDERRAGFAFAIPASPEWADALAEVELTGPVGSDMINADSNRPILILRERSSGHVRALLRGESATGTSLDAVTAAPLILGTNVDALFSRGLPQSVQR